MRISNLKNLAVLAAALGTLAALPAHAGKTLDVSRPVVKSFAA